MKKAIYILSILFISAAVYYFFFYEEEKLVEAFSFVEVERGDIEQIITSTGTLEPVAIVDIGTQVSGRIDQLLVDFNDKVAAGQLLAVIDTTFLAASVKDARATLARSEAQLNESVSKHERNIQLYEKGFISELDFITSETSVATSKAGLQSAKSALSRAITNLNYAYIYSPIDGTVINRNIEVGQTVASSLQAPTLFTIAENLSKMRILAQVDESDIGMIEEGQNVAFTVQTYMDKEFKGVVSQIRLQPQTVQNVVNYTVVIEADNKDGSLLPGMTATVDFYVQEKFDVLLIAASALKFVPPADMIEEYRERMQERFARMRDSLGQGSKSSQRQPGMMGGRGRGMMRSGTPGNQANKSKSKTSQIWLLDDEGKLMSRRIITGTSDGKKTEIVRGRDIVEGMKIINKINRKSSTEEKAPAQPMRFGRGF